MIPTHLIRTLDISAASGLVMRDGQFHVVADDENALCVFGTKGPSRRIALMPGELPSEPDARKKQKPDFEILVDLPGYGLLAIGSGSRATRERAVLVDRQEHTTVVDTSPLCTSLSAIFARLNLEGATLLGEELVLVQRGNRRDPRNALIFVSLHDLQHALGSRRFTLTRPARVVTLDLGVHENVPWSCTDLTRMDNGDLLCSVVLEDTSDSYEDGRCLGSALVRMAPDGTLKWHQRLDTLSKVEGIAMDGDSVWLVTDADDRAVPAQLLRATLR